MTTEQPIIKATSRYSLLEASRLLGISKRTICRWVDAKKIKVQYRKVNDQPFITGSEILRIWQETY